MPKRKPNMKTQLMKLIFSTVAMLTLVVGGATSAKAQDPLPSWNDGPAKQAILAFVEEVTDNKSNPKYVAPEDRIAIRTSSRSRVSSPATGRQWRNSR